ncbi:monovalent cation/H+ antiporter subunit D [Ramlibacter alkalitolerans]|uniref:Monovalent cation/H+ antiporter subunit D n=1 Tax=Ramlibacter alkalitolerans TaxID=2039631 RepID=A0ABS1JTH1_9BURK|nr:monovalent cation/H+ antiporter subunit D [Ramlibacter alkalitolerans]MBL0427518.1 monovalent cation/H+ antiporter subunit D [Ramlibacter alkalitolerans]
MNGGLPALAHLVVAPVLLPLATAALLLVVGDRWRRAKAGINALSMTASLLLAAWLLAGTAAGTGNVAVYLPGNWPVPFGIVLVLDPLAAGMLLLAACGGLAALLFSLARWHRASVHFHSLLQLQLMGLNGAFLTGDLFNLFVFFEVLLAASYGLLLHGGGASRVQPGLHYIAVNLLASFLFLIGVALLYGVTGTLSMADIARKLPLVPAADRGLLHAAAAILAVAFLAKAAFWPLNFWLPAAYAAASAPSAAMFAALTKVGVYAVLRLWMLCFPETAGPSAQFGGPLLVWGGLATLAFGSLGMLRSQQIGRLAGYSIIASSGTVLAATGLDLPALTAGALFYLGSSTLAAAALFLLAELVERSRQVEVDPPLPDLGERLPLFGEAPPADMNLDDRQLPLVGRAIPGALAFLAASFLLCTLVIAGLPPLSGFVGKLAMLRAIAAAPPGAGAPLPAGLLFVLLILSSLAASIALMRAFSAHFWAVQGRATPALRTIEVLPVTLLLAGCVLLAARGEHVLRFTAAAAAMLHTPQVYIDAVLRMQPVAAPTGGRP